MKLLLLVATPPHENYVLSLLETSFSVSCVLRVLSAVSKVGFV